MEFFRQEYWSELPFPTPGDLPDPGIKCTFLGSPVLAGRFFTTVLPGKFKHILPCNHSQYLLSAYFVTDAGRYALFTFIEFSQQHHEVQ